MRSQCLGEVFREGAEHLGDELTLSVGVVDVFRNGSELDTKVTNSKSYTLGEVAHQREQSL